MPKRDSYAGLSTSDTSQQAARIDMAGLVAAKFIELSTGNQEPLFESVQTLFADPERMIGCTLTLLNLLVAYVSNNGKDLMRLKEFTDYCIKSIRKDSATIDAIVREHG